MLILLIVLPVVFYSLYLAGYLPVSMRRAVMFVGSMGVGRNSCGASFTSCSGRIHRILRFPESRSYSFRLSGHVQQGVVEVQLLNRKREPVMILNRAVTSGILEARKGQRYYLYIHFRNASGDYTLDWV